VESGVGPSNAVPPHSSLADRFPRPIDLVLFIPIPLFVLGNDLYFGLVKQVHNHLWDFFTFRAAGHAVLHGASPYPDHATVDVLRAAKSFVYPPIASYLFVPFAAIPVRAAEALFVAGLMACLFLALRLLGVRDWRCYTVPLLWLPVYSSFSLGTISPVLALLLATAWRFRDERPRLSAAAIAAAIVAKVFLLPIVVWLLATRRWRAAAWTAVFGAAAFLIPFAPLGAHGFLRYFHLLRKLDAALATHSFSTRTLMHALGVGATSSTFVVALVVLALVVGALVFGRREGDAASLGLSLAAALVLSPIVWTHYYILLLVPIAIVRPRLSVLWFVPLVFWIEPNLEYFGDAWRLAVELLAGAAVCLVPALMQLRLFSLDRARPLRSGLRAS
jgi:hypothetical protein